VFVVAGFVTPDLQQFSTALMATSPGIVVTLVIGWIATAIVLLVFAVTRGTEGLNDYGPDPYGQGSLEEVFA